MSPCSVSARRFVIMSLLLTTLAACGKPAIPGSGTSGGLATGSDDDNGERSNDRSGRY